MSEMADSKSLEKRRKKLERDLKDAQDKFKGHLSSAAFRLAKADKSSKKGKRYDSKHRLTESAPFPFNHGETGNTYGKGKQQKEAKQGSLKYELWKREFHRHLQANEINLDWSEFKLQKLFKTNMDPEEAFRMYTNIREDVVEDFLEEGRVRIVKMRVRKGKVQRRKRVSNVKGYTMRKRGKGPARLVKMTAGERRKRKMGARVSKRKRRGKLNQIRRKRAISMRKRKNMGLDRKKRKTPSRRPTKRRRK